MDKNNPWIQTYSGRKFHPLYPNAEDITIQDIAHALSNLCRFTGHVQKFYSVAQHSVLVSYLCNEEDRLYALLHDASEAYISDISSPLKRSGAFEEYIKIEKTLQDTIYKVFGLTDPEPASVKKADLTMLATEARDLMKPLHPEWEMPYEPIPMKIDPLPPREAKDLFMKRYFELMGMDGAYEHYLRYEYGDEYEPTK